MFIVDKIWNLTNEVKKFLESLLAPRTHRVEACFLERVPGWGLPPPPLLERDPPPSSLALPLTAMLKHLLKLQLQVQHQQVL